SDPLTYTTQGTFTVHWTFNDGNGNTSTANQTVIVDDVTPPTISIVGSTTLYVECHTSYSDAGATAADNCDGNLTGSIATVNPVNVNVPGTYTVSYNVSDASGNAAAQVTRTIIVRDTTMPALTVLGANPMTVEFCSTFADPGATASDTCAGAL